MKEEKEIKNNPSVQIKNSAGITLIALIITIIVILILTGVALSSVLGENGIINRAENAVETSRINAAKEQIELALLATNMDMMKNKQPFDLDYVKGNIGKELNGLEILGTHGSPIDRVYVKYDDEQFMIDEEGNVIHIGDVELNTVPDLAVVPDQVKTGVDKVVLNLNSDVELGEITKISIKSGSTVIKEITGAFGIYEVTENGTYECTVVTDKGTEISKTITINNIKEEGYDLTGLMSGGDGGHNCIYKTVYDETNHWSECILCEEKVSEVKHTYTTTWASGVESCEGNNFFTKTCECGYTETGKKPCVWNGSSYNANPDKHYHLKYCTIHKGDISGPYYTGTYGVGEIKESGTENCYTSGNVKLTCQNTGTCAACKTTYSNKKHSIIADLSNNTVICSICKTNYGTFTIKTSTSNTHPITYTFDTTIKLTNGATLGNDLGSVRNIGSPFQNLTVTTNSINTARTEANVIKKATFTNSWNVPYNAYIYMYVLIGGVSHMMYSDTFYVYPDFQGPIINEVEQENLEMIDNWTTSKKITISGTENYCDTVTIEVKDEVGKTIYNGSAVVTNKAYSISFIPALEADETGRVFTVTVTDACNNKTETTFTVQKVDSKVPTISSITELGSSWSKRKNLSLEIIDEGVGNVEIAFNDTTSYEKLTEIENKFNKNYKFVGDLYQEIGASIYIKDGLENLLTETIKIGNVDNTSPTIIDVIQTKNGSTTVVTIEANDENETLKATGSGIAGYAVTKSKEIPSETIYQEENTFNIEIPGTYYVWVKDAVGNLAEIEEITVVE